MDKERRDVGVPTNEDDVDAMMLDLEGDGAVGTGCWQPWPRHHIAMRCMSWRSAVEATLVGNCISMYPHFVTHQIAMRHKIFFVAHCFVGT